MSFTAVKEYFANEGLADRVMEFTQSSATVEQAAKAVGCEAKQIAKTMSFLLDGRPILIVTAGDVKIDNKKYKAAFHQKAKMIPWEEVETAIGHAPGGVCPFVIKPDVSVYLDVSLKRFDVVYPAAGSGQSAVKLSPEELEQYASAKAWVDVCQSREPVSD